MRVTDLEKFALEEIWRPYWPSYPGYVEGTRCLSLPMGLEATARELLSPADAAWRDMVINRLSRIGVTLPEYVQHVLVRVVKARIAEWRESSVGAG